jgi:asparagine synthase (glutamine-hydrolysing)
MCGIIGLVHKDAYGTKYGVSGIGSNTDLGVDTNIRPALAELDLLRLAHRGPDGTGVYSDTHIQFGHARLSIIDLTEAGHQPMLSQDGRYVVTYNGEIYNHLELRAELESLGEAFISHSDTEVLLSAYKIWGADCVKRFRGMFAFVIWDNQTKTAFLARDRCGEKPLFYQINNHRLSFASELKALVPLLDQRPDLDPVIVDMYLHYQFVPEPCTLLKGVHKLAAGHTLTVSVDDWCATPQAYWCVETVSDPAPRMTDSSLILPRIRDALEDAVKMTLRSDVPVGVGLSGGIDSAAIAAFAQKNYPEPMHAFCVGYPGRPPYDERAQARALAESLGMIVHEVELPVESFVDFFPELVKVMDEPIADPAAFGHYSVPRAAADEGVKVLLSGIGGDEIFWGYPYVTQAVQLNQLLLDHPSIKFIAQWLGSKSAQHFLSKVSHYPHAHPSIKRCATILQKVGDTHNPSEQLMYYMLHPDFDGPFALKSEVYGSAMHDLTSAILFKTTAIGLRSREKIPAAIVRMLFDTWLTSNCLSLGDRVGMAVGVETRMPFLDANLIELVMSLRANNPDHALGQKAWLRAALKDVLPDEILSRPKAGFQPPLHEWLSGVVAKYGDMLQGGQLVNVGILSSTKIVHLLDQIAKRNWTGLFFTYKLVLLEMWYQKVVAT